jgi:hypothetical protein
VKIRKKGTSLGKDRISNEAAGSKLVIIEVAEITKSRERHNRSQHLNHPSHEVDGVEIRIEAIRETMMTLTLSRPMPLLNLAKLKEKVTIMTINRDLRGKIKLSSSLSSSEEAEGGIKGKGELRIVAAVGGRKEKGGSVAVGVAIEMIL